MARSWQSFCAALVSVVFFGVSGCSTPGGALVTGGAKYVYFFSESGGSYTLMRYPAGANGKYVSAASSIALPAYFTPSSIQVDSSGGVYVGGLGTTTPPQVLYYAAGATSPTRILNTGPFTPIIALDASGVLYVTGLVSSTISVYAAGASGTATPIRTIQLPASFSGTYESVALSVDSTGNLYLAGNFGAHYSGEVIIVNGSSSGAVTPLRTIDVAAVLYGVSVDGSGNFYLSETFSGPSGVTTPSAIAEYSSTSDSAVKTLTLSGTTPSIMNGLQVDGEGNVFALMQTLNGNVLSPSVIGVGPTAKGTLNPGSQAVLASLGVAPWFAAK